MLVDMKNQNRRKAAAVSATWWVASRLARREAQRRLDGLRPGAPKKGREGQMPNRNLAVAERATALVETVRPIVNRALNDPEFHAALRQAFDTGREVSGQVKGKPPTAIAKKLAHDRKLQKKVESSATDLQKAVVAVVAEPKKPSRVKRVVGRVLLVCGAAAAAAVALRKLRGAKKENPY